MACENPVKSTSISRTTSEPAGGHAKPSLLLFAILILALLLPIGPGRAAADQAWLDDASLRAVTFIDADRGWAAGDLGTLLKTVDGGHSWQPLPSGTTTHLDAIGMFNSQRGVAIGGSYQPHTQIGVGTALWTADGGETWLPSETDDLPPLRRLLMGLGGKCVAAGDWSPLHQTSVFVSSNGGQSWQPASTALTDPVIDVAGSVDDLLVLTDRGELLRIRSGLPPRQLLPPDQHRCSVSVHEQLVWVSHCAAADETPAGAAGEPSAAVVQLASVDFGETWQPVASDPQLDASWQTLLHAEGRWALAPASSHLYRASRFSPSHTATVISDVPMRALFRLDSVRGWAVGDWGTIAVTRDGGETWRTVRGGNRAAAVMVVAASGDRLPWSLLAMETLQNRRRVAIVTPQEEPLTREAARQLGPVAHYSVRTATASVLPAVSHDRAGVSRSPWPRMPNRSVALQRLLSDTSPQVVVLGQGLSSAEKSAWTQAAITAGVVRVFETGRENGQLLSHAAALTQVGKLAGDVWDDALMLLRPGTLPPDRIHLAPRYDTANDRLSIDGLASFVGNHPRYVRQGTASAGRRHVQILQARMGEASWVSAVLQSPLPLDQLMQQVDGQVARSSDENQQRLVYRLLLASQAADKPMVFQGLLELASRRWPDEPLGRLCQLYLDATARSIEWETFNRSELYLAKNKVMGAATQANLVQVSPFQTLAMSNVVSNAGLADSGISSDGGSSLSTIRLASASESPPRRLQQPRWDSHPAVRQVAQMLLRDSLPSPTEDSSGLVRLPSSQSAAGQERPSATQGTQAIVVEHRPILDGHLDEAMWQASQPIRLDDGSVAQLHIAHDTDFVYFGIRGPALQSPGGRGGDPTVGTERSRDQRLIDSDRYSLHIDVDGDLLTAYELEFNALGQTRDTYNGFTQWQPTWFLAHDSRQQEMVVEIAIKKSDLVPGDATAASAWNVSLSRSRPGFPSSRFSLPNPVQWCPIEFE